MAHPLDKGVIQEDNETKIGKRDLLTWEKGK